jgi:5'-3' exonuclease
MRFPPSTSSIGWYPRYPDARVKVHVIDGTYELFRAFYSPAGGSVVRGKEVGAARTMLRGFGALLRSGAVTHGGVAYDHVIESFRNDLFAGYKTGAGIEPTLYAQFELAERVAAALGLRVWSMVEHEADDALATAAFQLAGNSDVEQVIIATPDKDLCQVVTGSRIITWDRMRDRTFDEAGVHTRMGVGPASIPDLLALVGDDADGIPGLPRWGMRSAATVLAHYVHLENIPRQGPWEIVVRGQAALQQSLAAGWNDALLFRKLATLVTDAPIACTIDDVAWHGPDREALAALCDELETAPPL